MRSKTTMRAAACAATAILALAGAGCNAPPEGETQPAMGEEDAGFAEQLLAIEERLDFQFGPADRAPANILIGCAADPCGRTIDPVGALRICHPGNGNCPTEVRWRVVGAVPCWTAGTDSVVIQKKNGEEECFPQQTITGPPWTADSGAPSAACEPAGGQPTSWRYEIRLAHEGCSDIVLDPVIIIEP